MNPPNTSSEVDLELAKKFHETYERLAPDFGYETRDDTKQFDPQSKNGKLMVAVCHEINKDFHQSEIKGRIDELEKALLNISCFNPEVVKNRIEYLNQMKGKE